MYVKLSNEIVIVLQAIHYNRQIISVKFSIIIKRKYK